MNARGWDKFGGPPSPEPSYAGGCNAPHTFVLRRHYSLLGPRRREGYSLRSSPAHSSVTSACVAASDR